MGVENLTSLKVTTEDNAYEYYDEEDPDDGEEIKLDDADEEIKVEDQSSA